MVSQALQGLFRSLRIYHGHPGRQAEMDRLYSKFISSGDLAFDIGAHVGDRVSSFRRLGARVVAVEPQALAMRALRLIHGRDDDVSLIGAAVAAKSGKLSFNVNSRNPTVSTASAQFVEAAQNAPGWDEQLWDETIDVLCVTFDDLIARHGPPKFAKIDVEGFEYDVLRGLTEPIPALSFEFTTIERGVALKCVEHLAGMGGYAFNVALGESQRLVFDDPISADQMARYLRELAYEANSGDVYAVLKGP